MFNLCKDTNIMNKKILLPLISSAVLLIGVVSFNFLGEERQYQPREKEVQTVSGYESYLKQIRANQISGIVSNNDVSLVMNQISEISSLKSKADWPLKWEFKGPDNVGGRTRCLVIDKDNSNVMYTGGVSGSVFKSTNKGGSWRPITLGDDNFGVVSMAQTNDGSLFYGTGEIGLLLSNPNGTESSGFNGMGMYKSTDGETFSAVSNTSTFGNIYVLTSHPTQNIVFSGSSNGLRMTDNGGETWKVLKGGNCRDFKINKEGIALAYIGGVVWRSATPTDGASYKQVASISNSTRSAIAWSESDPSYCYVVSVGSVTFDGRQYGSALTGLYKSTDAGETFTKEVGEMSQFFAPFTIIGLQAQGAYDMAIAVHPKNKDRVFIGGIKMAEWTLNEGPKIVGNTANSPFNPFGIHSDKHFITFDNTDSDPIMYICSDGGVAATTDSDLSRYKDLSTGLITTQFFGIAADINGRVMGGTQDNGTIMLTGEAFPRKNGIDLLGGDGFQCEIAEFNTDYVFGETYNSRVSRSITGGSEMETIWDNRIRGVFGSTTEPSNYFNAALCLWESPDIIDNVKRRGRVEGEDTLLDARLYLAMNNGVWMCKNALSKPHDASNPKDEGAVRWFRVSPRTNVHYLETSQDGNSLFITTSGGQLHRVDSLLVAQFDTTSLPGNNDIAPKLTETQISGNGLIVNGRTITSISIDASDRNRAVVTVGNYNNNNFVYITNNLHDNAPTWTSIQGNLPKFPVYHAVISVDDPDVIVLGTEFGVWATSNGTSSAPSWSESLDGTDSDMPLPRVPVFDLVQVENKAWSGPRIYAGTHGMGIWESSSLLTSVPKVKKVAINNSVAINAYPNPVNNILTIDTDVKGYYKLSIYSINGQIVASQNGTNNGTLSINTEGLENGNYFIEIIGGNAKAVSKIIVQH